MKEIFNASIIVFIIILLGTNFIFYKLYSNAQNQLDFIRSMEDPVSQALADCENNKELERVRTYICTRRGELFFADNQVSVCVEGNNGLEVKNVLDVK